jgi:hypothetical protein
MASRNDGKSGGKARGKAESPVFDAGASIAAKEDGMRRAEQHAAGQWSADMYDLVVEVAGKSAFFTSDDVFELASARGAAPTHDNRAFGPVMNRAARDGICQKANAAPVNSRRKSRHSCPLAVWMSLINASDADGSAEIHGSIGRLESVVVQIERAVAKGKAPSEKQVARLLKAIRAAGLVKKAA